MPVHQVKSTEDYNNQLSGAGDKLVVVDFFATWCGPCKRISPFLEELSNQEEYKNAVFIKVDVDELEEVAKKEEISAMPTFYFYKSGKKVDELVGASNDELKKLINKNL